MAKRLTKSTTDKKIGGVCGGIAHYFDTNSTYIRLAWVLFCLLGGTGVITYIVLAILLPSDTDAV